MASPIPPNLPPQAVASVEDNGYVKAVVLAVVQAVRSFFSAIGRFFAFFNIFSKEEIPPPPSPVIHIAAVPSNLTVEEKLKTQLTQSEILTLFNTHSKITVQDRDGVYLKLADEERERMNAVWRYYTGFVQGTAPEHRIARGKEIAMSNPSLLIEFLKQKI